MPIQAILFDVDKFTIDEANEWIKKNGIVPIEDVQEIDNFYRYRINRDISQPEEFKRFRIMDVPHTKGHIKFIIGYA